MVFKRVGQVSSGLSANTLTYGNSVLQLLAGVCMTRLVMAGVRDVMDVSAHDKP